MIGGTVGYPPNPTTAPGLIPPIMRHAASVPRDSWAAAAALATGEPPRGVAEGTACSALAGKSLP